MDALELDPEYLRRLDKLYPHILEHMEQHKPDIYQEGDTYYCLSDSNLQTEISGSGKNMQDALEDWEKSYQKAGTDGKS